MKKFTLDKKLSRRALLKSMGAIGATTALAGCSTSGGGDTYIIDDGGDSDSGDFLPISETAHNFPCRSNCQSNCTLIAHIRNDRLVRTSKNNLNPLNGIEMDKNMSEKPIPAGVLEDGYLKYSRICLKGLSHVQRLYSKERLQKPLKRKSIESRKGTAKEVFQKNWATGWEDNWEEIEWDEALKLFADKLHEHYDDDTTKGVFGKKILMVANSGNYGKIHGISGAQAILANAMNMVQNWAAFDMSGPVGLSKVMGPGTFPFTTGNELRDIKNADNLILWSSNTAESHMVTWGFARDGKEAGTIKNIISVDVMANSTAVKSDKFYCVKPGSDNMLALGMINDVINRIKPHEDPAKIDYLIRNTNAPYLVREIDRVVTVKGNTETVKLYQYLRKSELDATFAATVIDPVDSTSTSLSSPRSFVVQKTDGTFEFTTAPRDAGGLDLWYIAPSKRTEIHGYAEDATEGAKNAYTLLHAAAIPVTLDVAVQADTVAVKTVYQMLQEKAAQYDYATVTKHAGVSEVALKDFVDIYTTGKSTIYVGFGTSHNYNSHSLNQALAVLGAITGNIGKEGASIGNFFAVYNNGPRGGFENMPSRVVRGTSKLMTALAANKGGRGVDGTIYPQTREGEDVKMIFVANSNPVSNNVNTGQDYLETLFNGALTDFAVTIDLTMTDTARMSDLVLPTAHWLETEDVLMAVKNPFVSYQEKIISKPLGDCKSDMNILRELSKVMASGSYSKFNTPVPGTGLNGGADRSVNDMLNDVMRPSGVEKSDWNFIEDLVKGPATSRISPANLKYQKVVRVQTPNKLLINLEAVNINPTDVDDVTPKFVSSAGNSQLITTGITGKLELFCEDPYEYVKFPLVHDDSFDTRYWKGVNYTAIPGIPLYGDIDNLTEYGQQLLSNEQFPQWTPPSEIGEADWLNMSTDQIKTANDYPFVYIQEHPRWRVHTQWTTVPWLRELDPEPLVKLNPADALAKGIKTGDMVQLFNSRGSAVFKAIVTPMMQKGVVNTPKGWQRGFYKEVAGVEVGGDYNDLTNPDTHPIACDHIYFDARVDIKKVK